MFIPRTCGSFVYLRRPDPRIRRVGSLLPLHPLLRIRPHRRGEHAATRAERDGLMPTTSDPSDPRLTRGADDAPVPQAEAYLVLSDEERAAGFVRPVRRSYVHLVCGTSTRMSQDIAETFARDPHFYGSTYCVSCGMHRLVGIDGEFEWED